MKCRVCGGTQRPSKTDLPFKTEDRSIAAQSTDNREPTTRGSAIRYILSGTGIPSSPSVAVIVWRKISAQTARRWRSAGSFSLRIGYLW